MNRSLLILILLVSASILCSAAAAQETYPLGQQSVVSAGFGTHGAANAQRGWQFRANIANITVTKLGCYYPDGTASAKTVTLFDASTQAVIAQATCGPGSGWQFTTLSSPVTLTNGGEYVIEGFTTTSSHYFKMSPGSAWLPSGDIEYLNSRHAGSTTASTFPTGVSYDNQFGVVDFGYTVTVAVETPAQLPDAGEGSTYTQNIQAVNGSTPYTWVHTSGALPSGLSLTQIGDEFQLAGTPAGSSTGNYTFNVEVTDDLNNSHTKTMTLYVSDLLISTNAQLPDGAEGSSYSQNIQASNGPTPYSWSHLSGTLPSGLSLTQVGDEFQLAGTPANGTLGSYSFVVQVTDHNSAIDTKTMTLYIDWAAGAVSFPFDQQDPMASGFNDGGASTIPLQYGWRFKAKSQGLNIVKLGCNFPNGPTTAYTVTLFDFATEAILAQVVCPSGNGWQFTDLSSPVPLANGSEYVIAGHTLNGYYNGGSGGNPPASWMPSGDIEYVDCRYKATYSTNTFPTATLSMLYGIVDIGYSHDLSITTDASLPNGTSGTSYSTSIQADFGTTPYTWTHVSGSLPNGINLTQAGNDFKLSGTPTGAPGTYSFDVLVTDALNDTSTKTMLLYIMPQPVSLPFMDDFSTDKTWQYGTDWTRAPAIYYTASAPSRTEPGTDHSPSSDNTIAGHLLGADYSANMNDTVWLTTPPIDCSSASIVSLRYYRWLGSSLGDNAVIEVSNNGTVWNNVWTASASSNTNDTTWTFMGHDISTWAAGQPSVRVRFGVGPTGAIVNTGWCIDDVEIIEPGPELVVREGGATGAIIIDNESVGGLRDFGQVGTSTSSSILTIDLKNNGTNTITFGAWNKTGANPGDFYVITNPPTTLAPNTSDIMQIQFYSTSVGTKTATIELPHDAAGSGTTPFEINVRAEAVSNVPLIRVSDGNSLSHNSPVTGARDFGSVLVGASSTVLTIEVSNLGAVNLTVGGLVLAGPDASQFTLGTAGYFSPIASTVTASFDLSFTPTNAGVKNATVSFTHNDTSVSSPFVINITGDGVTVAPKIEVRETDVAGAILSSPAPANGILDFGNHNVVAGPTAASTVFIKNTGTAPLLLGTPVLSQAANFVLDTTGFPSSLAVGASTTFGILFDPSVSGVSNALVSFSHNDGTTSTPFQLNVTGTGVSPIIEVRETSAVGPVINSGDVAALGAGRDLGSIDVSAGATGPVIIVIWNTGSAPLIVGTPTLAGMNSTDFILDTTGILGSLNPNSNTSFSIVFNPSLGGIKEAWIEFTHNDPTSTTPFIVPIIATAIDPSGIQITTTSLPSGTSGVAYQATPIDVIQGSAPYTWSVYSGNLPSGLALGPGGIISGTPTAIGGTTYIFTVRVADTTGTTHEKQFSIDIAGSLVISGSSGNSGSGGCAATKSSLALPLLLLMLAAYRRRRNGRPNDLVN